MSGQPPEADDFAAYRRDPTRSRRNSLVMAHRGLAVHIAHRYANRGIPVDDLEQVAMLGLIKAVERYDPDRGVAFASFASPTIDGELKRHFRDAGWAVRAPTRLKDLHVRVQAAREALMRRLGRAPTVGELAVEVGDGEESVLAAIEAGAARRPTPLSGEREDGTAPERRLGREDEALAGTARRVTVQAALGSLPERERRILELRFAEDLTQSEIAERIGISQMHVSRLLRRALATLADRMEG